VIITKGRASGGSAFFTSSARGLARQGDLDGRGSRSEVARKAEVSRIENVASSYLFNEESKGMPDPDNDEPQG